MKQRLAPICTPAIGLSAAELRLLQEVRCRTAALPSWLGIPHSADPQEMLNWLSTSIHRWWLDGQYNVPAPELLAKLKALPADCQQAVLRHGLEAPDCPSAFLPAITTLRPVRTYPQFASDEEVT